MGRSALEWMHDVCVLGVSERTTGSAVTSEACAACGHLSTPISTVCVPLSGLGSRAEHDETVTKKKKERERHNCEGMENSLSKELWLCVWGGV